MNIMSINPNYHIQKTRFKNYSKAPSNLAFKGDTFEKSTKCDMSKETFEKAKNLVMETILCDDPKESAVLVQDDKIMFHVTGNTRSIFLDPSTQHLIYNPDNNIIFIHSHPKRDNGGMPVSIDDCVSLLWQGGVKSVYAINHKGEYSMLAKTLKKLDANALQQFDKNYEYETCLIDSFEDETERKDYENFLKRYKNAANKIYEEGDNIDKVLLDYRNYMQKIAEAQKTPQILHQFWQENAPKIDLVYETNYSF